MINDIIFITMLIYPSFKHMMNRVIVRDDRLEMIKEIEKIINMKSDMFVIDCIAEYNFKERLTKYYTVEQFLE